MRDIGDILWGIVLIAVAILLVLNFTHVITLQPFNGWWTLFIIVPSAIALTKRESRKGAIVGLVIGIILFCSSNHMIDMEIAKYAIIIFILLAIGVSLLIKGKGGMPTDKINVEDNADIKAVFGGYELNYSEGQEFKGCNCKAVFGGLDIDLSNSKFSEDRVLNVKVVFGGADVRVPSNVNIEVDSTGIFGGVQNRTNNGADNEFTLYIHATAAFGAVDIK